MADAWCAAFMQPKTTDTAGDVVTTRVLRRIADADPERITAEEQEELFDLGDPGGPIVPPEMRDTIAEQANRYRFFHWHLEFPHIFPVPEDPTRASAQGWEGGFTCIVGNPPWERVQAAGAGVLRRTRPADRRGEERGRAQEAHRGPAGRRTRQLWTEWTAASRAAEAESGFLRLSGRYPLCGRGDVNTYSVFAETFRGLHRPDRASRHHHPDRPGHGRDDLSVLLRHA